jgi:putative tricarboxylic transport membrane protein
LASAPRLSEIGQYKDVEYRCGGGVVGPKGMSPAAAQVWSDALKAVSESQAWKNDYIGKFKLLSEFKGTEEATAFMADFQASYLKSIGK